MYALLEKDAEAGVWTGRLTETYAKLKLSQRFYTPIMRVLNNSGCIEMLQRGARGHPSIANLVRPPTTEDIELVDNRKSSLTDAGRPDKVGEVEKRVSVIEKRLGNLDILEAMANFENRLKEIEATNAKTTKSKTTGK